jgi:hypothetical protein
MKRLANLPSIEKRVAKGMVLPTGFKVWLKQAAAAPLPDAGWFKVQWTDPAALGLGKRTRDGLLPFLRLGAGGFVALWWPVRGKPLVVECDSEGGSAVRALDFDDFRARMARKKTGLYDLDAATTPMAGPARTPKRIPPGRQRELMAWLAARSDQQPPTQGAGDLLAKWMEVSRRMVTSKRVPSVEDWWTVRYTLEQQAGAWHVTYQTVGTWKPVPKTYGAEGLAAPVVALCKHPGRSRYELAVNCKGTLSVDRDQELLLKAP